MDLIIGIIAIYIIYKLAKGAMANEKPNRLTQAAQSADCTREILRVLENASTAGADKVDCALSVHSFASAGMEHIRADVTFHSAALAAVYAAAQEEWSEFLKRPAHLQVTEQGWPTIEPRVRAAFLKLFPAAPSVWLSVTFVDHFDDRVTVNGDAVSGWMLFEIGDLGIGPSKNDLPRAPFVIDAVSAEIGKRSPNMTVHTDKSIPANQ